MKAILTLALLASLATNAASGLGRAGNGRNQQTNLHRLKRAIPLIALKSGGSGASPLPPHVDPNIGMSTALNDFHKMPVGASFSGPLAVTGMVAIATSLAMAYSYFQAVNEFERSPHAYTGPYYRPYGINPESFVSLVNSYR